MFKVGDKVVLTGEYKYFYNYLGKKEDSILVIHSVDVEKIYIEVENENGDWELTDEIDYIHTSYGFLSINNRIYYVSEGSVRRAPDTRPKEEQLIDKIKKLWERQEYVKSQI